MYYTLDENKNPVECSLKSFINQKRDNFRVNRTELDKYLISTVFLGVTPVLFETMVFEKIEENKINLLEIDCNRYETWSEAEKGHEEMVKKWTDK